MKPTDIEEFTNLLAGVHEFYGKKMSVFSTDVWIQTMQGYDLAAIRDALGRHAMNPDSGQFMPKPADVVRMIDGGTTDSALVAWSKFDKALRSVGPYMSVAFDDPIIHRVIEDMGGWTSFTMKTEEEWPFISNDFVKRYRGYSGRRITVECKPKMLGMIDADRESKGLNHDPKFLRLIGNKKKAVEVMRLGVSVPSIEISTENIDLKLLTGGQS